MFLSSVFEILDVRSNSKNVMNNAHLTFYGKIFRN